MINKRISQNIYSKASYPQTNSNLAFVFLYVCFKSLHARAEDAYEIRVLILKLQNYRLAHQAYTFIPKTIICNSVYCKYLLPNIKQFGRVKKNDSLHYRKISLWPAIERICFSKKAFHFCINVEITGGGGFELFSLLK